MMRSLCNAIFLSSLWFAAPASAVNFLTEENPPLNFLREGEVSGIGTGVIREMAKRASVPATILLIPWADAYARAQNDADSCVFSTVRNTDREKLFQWAGPIARGEWSLFAREGFPADLKKLDQLMKYRVGVVNDARAVYLRGRGFKNLVTAERNLDLAAMLTGDAKELGRTDLWFTQSAGAKDTAKQAGITDIKLVFSALMSQDYWLACSPKLPPETMQALRAAISAMRADGTYKQLTAPPAQ
jgi:polar amino acid transport system substrate-binding protein